jgi:superfamily I DNA and/or RNA helicase
LLAAPSTDQKAAVTDDDVLVVAPYNAHVALIREHLANANLATVRVGTVDKFQGQEATIAIYSMATSSTEEAPRGMDFLYDRHRLNVATSRARAAAILIANPRLLRPNCRTPEQLRLASAMSRFVELARLLKQRSN